MHLWSDRAQRQDWCGSTEIGIICRNHPLQYAVGPVSYTHLDVYKRQEVYDEFYDTSDGEDSDKNGGWTIGKLLKCDQVWIVALVTGVFQICSVGTMSQMINRTTNGFGFSITVAASIMSACAIVGVVGSFLIGVLDVYKRQV